MTGRTSDQSSTCKSETANPDSDAVNRIHQCQQLCIALAASDTQGTGVPLLFNNTNSSGTSSTSREPVSSWKEPISREPANKGFRTTEEAQQVVLPALNNL